MGNEMTKSSLTGRMLRSDAKMRAEKAYATEEECATIAPILPMNRRFYMFANERYVPVHSGPVAEPGDNTTGVGALSSQSLSV